MAAVWGATAAAPQVATAPVAVGKLVAWVRQQAGAGGVHVAQ